MDDARTPGDRLDDLHVSYRRRPEDQASPSHLFAGLRVREFKAALAWYERLLGEPASFPHSAEAVWHLGQNQSLYIVEHPEAGHSAVTIFVDDLDARLRTIAGRGLEPHEHESYANGVRKAVYRDPDGNEVAFGGPSEPASSG